jgi:hypothetical protein
LDRETLLPRLQRSHRKSDVSLSEIGGGSDGKQTELDSFHSNRKKLPVSRIGTIDWNNLADIPI